MSQPKWKYIGYFGDIHPLDYGGGFIYQDETGVYDPEMVYFEPDDEKWEEFNRAGKDFNDLPIKIYRIIIEKDSKKEWWWDDLYRYLTAFDTWEKESLENVIKEHNPIHMANVYYDLIHCFGAMDFDNYPDERTVKECKIRYKEELEKNLKS